MDDPRPLDEYGFPMHIDQIVKEGIPLPPFDYEAEWEAYKSISDMETEAIMKAGIGEAMYQTRIEGDHKWQEGIAAQKEKMRK